MHGNKKDGAQEWRYSSRNIPFQQYIFSQLQFQLVRNSVLEVKVAIQGEQIKKTVEVLDLAKCSNSKTSPHQDSVSSTKEVAMEEDTVQQRHGDMENEEMDPVFEAENQLEACSGKYFNRNIKVLSIITR